MNAIARKTIANRVKQKMMLQGSVMADRLSAEELNNILDCGVGDVILIDCRPFILYNEGHIIASHNVYYPPIVKRRSRGNIPLDNIIRCPKSKAALLEGRIRTLIVYDDSTQAINNIERDSTMLLVLKCLQEGMVSSDFAIRFLEGGYDKFVKQYSQHCTCQDTEAIDTYSLLPLIGSTSQGTVSNVVLTDTIKCSPSQDQGDPVQILPWLYLGNVWHASQDKRLLSLGVTAQLNVSPGCNVECPAGFIRYKAIPVEDNCIVDIGCWFPEAIDFIESVRNSQGKVLVHCHAGISRSATICIAYLMYLKRFSLDEAFDFLKSKRSIISPNLNFMRQLAEFGTQLLHSRKAEQLSSSSHMDIEFDFSSSPSNCNSDLSPIGKNTSPSLTLALTHCTQQAAFRFESPCSGSPTLNLCSSPVLSPS